MFEKAQDIEEILKKQWSSYFQRLLREQRFAEGERKRIDLLSERFEELKTAILSSINDGDQKEIARGVVKYRRLFDFVLSISARDLRYIKTTNDTWNGMLEHFGIVDTISLSPQDETFDGYSRIGRIRVFLLKPDDTFYEVRISMEWIRRFENEWREYISLDSKTREVIAEALSELPVGHIGMRYINKPFGELYPQYRASLTAEEAEEAEEATEP